MIGFFTGVAVTFLTIWFKAYLENNYAINATTRQRAIEAFKITNELIFSLHPKQVLCLNLLRDKDIETFIKLSEHYPESTLDKLGHLEILIINNFIPLKLELIQITNLITTHLSLLMNIVLNYSNSPTNIDDLIEKNKEFNKAILVAGLHLRESLTNEYINKKGEPINFFYYTLQLFRFLKMFFNPSYKN